VEVTKGIVMRWNNFSLASRCVMCFHKEESVDHLFVHCKLVYSLWALAISLMGISWVQSSNVKDVLVAWKEN